jgi:hypothetical protein
MRDKIDDKIDVDDHLADGAWAIEVHKPKLWPVVRPSPAPVDNPSPVLEGAHKDGSEQSLRTNDQNVSSAHGVNPRIDNSNRHHKPQTTGAVALSVTNAIRRARLQLRDGAR